MVQVKYIGPHDEVEIPVLGMIVARGDVFETTPDLAGRPPSGSPPTGEPGDEDYDPGDYDLGEGLLAQVDNFEAVKASKTKTVKEV